MAEISERAKKLSAGILQVAPRKHLNIMEPQIQFTSQVRRNQENFFSQTRPQRPQTKPPQRSVPMFVQEEIDDLSNKINVLQRLASGIDISEADREFLNKCLFKAHNTNDLDAQENIHIEIMCCQARIDTLRRRS